jgi:hypothetical protein
MDPSNASPMTVNCAIFDHQNTIPGIRGEMVVVVVVVESASDCVSDVRLHDLCARADDAHTGSHRLDPFECAEFNFNIENPTQLP